MRPEQGREPLPDDLANPDVASEGDLPQPSGNDPYEEVFVLAQARVDQLKQAGKIRRVEDIATEFDLDNHFDDLASVFRQTCLAMQLPWPPLPFSPPDSDTNN